MFGVIKIERIGGGFFKRLRYRLFPPEPVIERISVLGSAPFFTLTLVCDEMKRSIRVKYTACSGGARAEL